MTDIDFRQAIDQIKNRIDIVDVIGSRIDLNRQNKALCPFHEEKTPSFSVNAKGQYFHCFGCGVGGDVVRFIELHEQRSFMEALAVLAEQAGIELPQLDGASLETLKTQRSIEDVLTATAHYYHKRLPPETVEYLTQERGFTKETIERFLIGWADGGLKEYLTGERDFPLDLCLEAGVLRRTDGNAVRDHFYKRIIFPNLKRGRVVHMTGRSTSDKGPKYLHLPGKIEHLFNEDDLRSEEAVLTEGVPDCLSAIQAGHKAVAMLGTSHFNESLRGRFDKCGRVYVCMDGDQAGHQAAVKVSRILADKAIIVNLPEGQDVNEYLNSQEDDEFRRLLDEGRRFLDVEIDRIGGLPENIREDELKTFLPLLRQLGEFEREKYTAVIKREFKLNKKTINIGIDAGDHDSLESSTSDSTAPPLPEITEEEEQQALVLLKDPDLIKKVADITSQLGCVGEDNNKIIIYLTMTSRILCRPISLIVKGESSGGKSFLVETVSKLFPKDKVLAFTTLTPKALYHRPDGLAHKVLIVFERPGAEDCDYSIRSLQSEGKLLISMPIQDPETNQWVTIDKEIEGPIAYIETTTKPHLHPENETRCFEIFIDDSEKQTRLVHQAQNERFMVRDSHRSVDTGNWIVAQRMLESYPVLIEYVELIDFPDKPLRVRRDHDRLLTLIEASAILHQYQRERRDINGTEYLIASLDDYVVAYALALDVLQQTIKQITPKAERLALLISELQGQNNGQPLSRKDIVEKSEDSPNTVKKYLGELVQQAVIHEDRSTKAYQYGVLKLPDENTTLLLHPDKLRDRFEKQESSQLAKPDQTCLGQDNIVHDKELLPSDQPTQEKCRA
jgi:DNA primase catalytic core